MARHQCVILLTGLWLSGLGLAPISAQDANQRLADAVAQTLRQRGRLRHYQVDIQAVDGAVELRGRVADPAQRQQALRIAAAVPGVAHVRDRLIVGERTIVPVLLQDDPEVGPQPNRLVPAPEAMMVPGIPGAPCIPGAPGAPSSPSCPFEPLPFNSSSPNDIFTRPPPLPPYAWPTYAPYNNYSRVAYPTLYPADSWPAIGPFYPFPKPAMGWRSVSLTWQDGYWWYGRGVTGHDWWRVRYK